MTPAEKDAVLNELMALAARWRYDHPYNDTAISQSQRMVDGMEVLAILCAPGRMAYPQQEAMEIVSAPASTLVDFTARCEPGIYRETTTDGRPVPTSRWQDPHA